MNKFKTMAHYIWAPQSINSVTYGQKQDLQKFNRKGLKIGSKHGLKPIFPDFCFLKTKVLDIFVNNEKMEKKSPSPEGRFSRITRQILYFRAIRGWRC